ncbi:MAG TPA: hypothetical protein VJ824_12880 [Bacillota bacterium]|nr:hypothetical protein [Bacillota bacterium]
MNKPNSEALIESKSLRDSHINNVEVLNKVKALSLLPDDIHTTIEHVANYFEVTKRWVEELIADNREEVQSDGLKIVSKKELTELNFGDLESFGISKYAASITLIPRRAVLRIGMLLRDSQVAKRVRDYLLNVENTARIEAPEIIEKAIRKPTWNQIQSNVRAKSKLYKMLGLPESSALAHALNHEEMETGVDLTPFKRLVREEDTDHTVTPTELGNTFDPVISAKKINMLLEQCGLQVKNVKKEWDLTDKGKPFAKLTTTIINKKDKSKTVSSEKQAIRWKLSVLELLRPFVKGEKAI